MRQEVFNTVQYLKFRHKYSPVKGKEKFIDADGSYGYQCIDLIRQYVKEYFNYNWIPVDYARNVSSKNLSPNKRKEIKIGIEDFKVGDIVTFDIGKMGHIGIIARVFKSGFHYIDQNGIGGAGNVVNGVYPKIIGNGVQKRKFKRGDHKILKCFRFIG